MRNRITCVGLCLVVLSGCGSDSDPSQACNQIVDAFANAWARCGVMTYDAAKQQWSKAFSGCAPSNVDQSKVDQCSTDLGNADCNLIKNGGSPANCKGVLAQ